MTSREWILLSSKKISLHLLYNEKTRKGTSWILTKRYLVNRIVRSEKEAVVLHMFFETGVLKNFSNFTGKCLCWSLFLIKLQAWMFATLLKRDHHMYFPMKFAQLLTTPFFIEHLRWLLLESVKINWRIN